MNEARNPYSPPVADVADPIPELSEEGLIPNGRRVPAGNGVRWLREAMRLYFLRPWKWIGVMLLIVLASIVASMIPLSNLLSSLLWPIVCGGLMFAVSVLRQTGSFTIANVFAGFGPRFVPLAIVGGVMLLMAPVMYLTFLVFAGSDIANAMVLGDTEAIDPTSFAAGNFWMAMLVYMLLAVPIGAATYLAPALIMLHDMKPGEAMKMSFIATIKNILAGLVFWIVLMLFILVSILPLGLGLFVSLPVTMITIYTMYRDIFVETE